MQQVAELKPSTTHSNRLLCRLEACPSGWCRQCWPKTEAGGGIEECCFARACRSADGGVRFVMLVAAVLGGARLIQAWNASHNVTAVDSLSTSSVAPSAPACCSEGFHSPSNDRWRRRAGGRRSARRRTPQAPRL